MSNKTHDFLTSYLDTMRAVFQLLDHRKCRTSAESAAARASAGAPGSVGAKALILKLGGEDNFVMAVIPGFNRLVNNAVREELGKFRFATPDEIARVTNGLEPGMIPPFGPPVLPMIKKLIVDDQLGQEPSVGFNAAMFEKSVVMSGSTYLSLVPDALLLRISEAQTNA